MPAVGKSTVYRAGDMSTDLCKRLLAHAGTPHPGLCAICGPGPCRYSESTTLDSATMKVGVEVDTSGIDAARAAFDALSVSIHKVTEALHQMGGAPHGGFVVRMVGEVVEIDVRPPAA